MPRSIHVFRSPDRFVAGTVGEPGNRTFYLQAVHETRIVTVMLEKQQVSVLAERIGTLLSEVHRRFGTPIPPEPDVVDDLNPLVMPVDAEFRVGTMGLGWDAEANSVVVELLAVSEQEFDASVVLDDSEEGPDAVRVFLSLEAARQFATRSTRVVSAGRPPVRYARNRWTRPGTSVSAPTAIAAGWCPGQQMTQIPNGSADTDRAAIRDSELTVIGRIRSASNATFLCEVQNTSGEGVHCVYKPVRGEQPLWDFPDGTLAGREVATYLISAELGWNVVPYTVFRDGPAGVGMVQQWIHEPELAEGALDLVDICLPEAIPSGYLPILRALDADGAEIVLVHADDSLLRRMAVFDTLVNNADRKGGHILRAPTAASMESITGSACMRRTSCGPSCGDGRASPSSPSCLPMSFASRRYYAANSALFWRPT